MGAWGTSLYSNDFAADLRSLISAVARLPYDGDRLAEIICSTERSASEDPSDEYHTIFWLVLAGQFEKKGIASARVCAKAISIIYSESDTAVMASLGMKPAALRKREATLAELWDRISAAPTVSSPRATLKAPDPYVMDPGGVYSFPTLEDAAINPYMPKRLFDRSAWNPDGFGLMVPVERGRAFDFLAWYRMLVIEDALPTIPSLEKILSDFRWNLADPGTCSASHFKKIEIKKVSLVEIDPVKLEHTFPKRAPGTSQAVQGISIVNGMDLRRLIRLKGRPPFPRNQGPFQWPTMNGLGMIVK